MEAVTGGGSCEQEGPGIRRMFAPQRKDTAEDFIFSFSLHLSRLRGGKKENINHRLAEPRQGRRQDQRGKVDARMQGEGHDWEVLLAVVQTNEAGHGNQRRRMFAPQRGDNAEDFISRRQSLLCVVETVWQRSARQLRWRADRASTESGAGI